MSLALRLGLASHPHFAGEVHQRLVMDCLFSDVPIQWLSVPEIAARIQARYEGIALTAPQLQKAIDELKKVGWIDDEGESRTGTRRLSLTGKGLEEWQRARTAGVALEREVKEKFIDELGLEPGAEADQRWTAMLGELDGLFRKEAHRIARALLSRDDLDGLAPQRRDDESEEERVARQDVALLLNQPQGERVVFLRRVLHSALAYHLFRTTPDADQAVVQHLRGRTFYLDTSVLYALIADDGELATLGRDLLRLAGELDCRLRVTTDTLQEFHNSTQHYKRLLLEYGVSDAGIARAVLDGAENELDDFRRGYYRALIRDPGLSVEEYAVRYETIEEKLTEWGIPRPEVLPTNPVMGPDGKWIQIENIEEYAASLYDYLADNPRSKMPQNDDVRRALVRHDALHVAWVEKERRIRDRVMIPQRPSQVKFWFLARDRRLCDWDWKRVQEHGPGSVPRCVGLEEWIASVAIFVPSAREAEVINAFALRLLAMSGPAIPQKAELSVAQLEEIGRVAQALGSRPDEAARVAADHVLMAQLDVATNGKERREAIESSLARVRAEDLARLEKRLEAIEPLAAKAARLEAENRLLKEKDDAKTDDSGLRADAEKWRFVKARLPWAAGSMVVALGVCVVLLWYFPALWATATLGRRLFVGVGILGVTAAGPLIAFSRWKTAGGAMFLFVTAAGISTDVLDVWDRTARPAPVERPARETAQSPQPDSAERSKGPVHGTIP